MLKKMMAVALSMALVLGMLPMSAFAAEKAEKAEADKRIKKFAEMIIAQNEEKKDPFDFVTEESKMVLQDQLPEKFDLSAKFIKDGDETPYVTPIKFQNPFGTCWGFAAIAAAESSLLGSGLAEEDGYDASTLNLSEKHLVYFINQALDRPGHPQDGEGTHALDTWTVSDKLNTGGQMMYAMSLFASGIGPDLEDRTDPNDGGKSMKDLLEYRGREGNVQKRKINGVLQNFCYDDEDDWSIPEQYRLYQSYVLKESVLLPTPTGGKEKYEYNPDATDAIKNELLKKRGVAVAFHADSFMPGQEAGDGQFISRNWAHYTYNDANANHGVCIVGWDDTYPKENFVEGHQPPYDGAWLVKNSWGSGEEEFPNKGNGDWGIPNEKGEGTGYFWLSYYDQSLSMLESYEFDKSNVGKKYYLNQHDFLGTSSYETVERDDPVKMANVFKAEVCQNVEQVTCETTRPGTIVETEIYLLNDNYEDPEDGKLVASFSQSFDMGGFHKMTLATPVTVQKNQYFSVIQKHTNPAGENVIVMPKGLGKAYSDFLDIGKWGEGVINAKESYVHEEGEWDDYKDIIDYVNSGDSKDFFAFDNFPIKAYATEKDNLRMKVISSVKLPTRGEETSDMIRVSFKGDMELLPDDIKVKTELAEGGDQLVSVTADPKDDTRLTIKALKAGDTYLYISADDIGTSVVKITTIEPTLIKALTFDSEVEYTGKPIKPDVIVADNLGSLANIDQFTVSYKNNVKCGKGTIIVKPAAGSMYTGSCKTTFKILPKRSVISKITAGKSKLTVTVKNQKKSGVTKYQVSYRVAGTNKVTSKTFKSKTNKFTLKGLKKGTKYEVAVRAYAKNAGYGIYSKIKTSPAVK